MKLQFSGHESFICKHFWLKKGYDYISQKGNFNDESAVIDLGVGKNMVTSISFWLKAFGLVDPELGVTELANFLFHEKKGTDQYIENLGSVWLLHYALIKTNKASLYNLFFNEFRKGRTDFTKDQLLSFIKRSLEDESQNNFNENTINSDISVFIRNYLKPSYKETKIDIEEDFSSLMIDLDLIKSYKAENAEGKIVEWYQVENKIQIDLPADVVLFTILDNEHYSKSIAFKELLTGYNSPGIVFALNEEGLYSKIEQIVKNHKGVTYTETAGVRELQIKVSLNKWDVLHGYYKN
ncbi:MAG: DUF4007 family protein [Chitinophagaceae bacterium]|nr:DUF4007 family protein [Chitinophagaceae bacterium]